MQRTNILERMREKRVWDVIVIGGGATGLGAAVDAAARGYTTLLLEALDFAKGTSSRSTKLVHGGVRYLEQGNVSLVREALHERGLLFRNAPHLTHTLPFVIPAYHWWELPFYATGLTLYDVLAGRLGIGRTQLVSHAQVLRRIPTLKWRGLRGGIVYYDGQFDDARLAVTLLRTLLDLGGVAANYMPVIGLIKEGDRLTGVRARDGETGEELELRARAVVNATGIYVDRVRQMDEPDARAIVVPSRGTHLVLDQSFLPGNDAIMIPHTDDGRVLFIIPWHQRALVGTTDVAADGTPIEPRATEEEIAFLLGTAARYLSRVPRREDVLAVYAGLRPLVSLGGARNTAALSRDHTILVSKAGLITITGGKWTTYRRMGADVINRARAVAGLEPRPSVTSTLKLHGWEEEPTDTELREYGSDAPSLRRLLAEYPEWSERLDPALPYYAGQVIWATRYEMARTIEDALARRTRALFLDAAASVRSAPRVASMMARELGQNELWERVQVREYAQLAAGYRLPVEHPEPGEGDSENRAVAA